MSHSRIKVKHSCHNALPIVMQTESPGMIFYSNVIGHCIPIKQPYLRQYPKNTQKSEITDPTIEIKLELDYEEK